MGIQVWGGKVLFRRKHGGKIAASPACCCEEGGPCECPTECVEGYYLDIEVPPEHEAWVTLHDIAACLALEEEGLPVVWTGGYLQVSNMGPPQTWYELQWGMGCEVVDGQTVWTVGQRYGGDAVILLNGVFYCGYIATKTFTTDCGDLPPAGVISDWTIEWDPVSTGYPQPDGFPLDIEISDNPFP